MTARLLHELFQHSLRYLVTPAAMTPAAVTLAEVTLAAATLAAVTLCRDPRCHTDMKRIEIVP